MERRAQTVGRWLPMVGGVAVLAALYGLRGLLLPPSSSPPLTPPCDLTQQLCRVSSRPEGAVTLDLTPRPLRAMQPLQLDLTLPSGVEPIAFVVRGVNMEMGESRWGLTPSTAAPPSATGERSYRAQVMLPICTTRQMEWRGELQLSTAGREWSLPFDWITYAD